jgi:hypothetical protein
VAEVSAPPSAWQLRTDLAWARSLLWFARSGRGGREPKRDVHLFMADRYGRLADYYAARGAAAKARRMSQKSEWHYRQGGLDDPPRAVALAMPVPGAKPVDAVSDKEVGGDDVA